MAVYAQTLLVLLTLCMNNQSVKGDTPKEEVVSIYNDNFTTPYSREPYFIKVFRCTNTDRCWYTAGNSLNKYPVPANNTASIGIAIVVQDINNATKFYKYIVYNHTSCKCGNVTALRKSLQKNRHVHSVEISKTYYENHFKKNPVNLRGCKSFCKTPQPRTRFTKERFTPSFVYIKNCLPGCNASTEIIKVKLQDNNKVLKRQFKNDKECRDYNINPNPLGQTSKLLSAENPSTPSLTVPGYPLAIYIGSTRIFLAALLLSLLLLTILIVDFTFCRRKRGFLYNLFSSKTKDNECLKCRYKETVI